MSLTYFLGSEDSAWALSGLECEPSPSARSIPIAKPCLENTGQMSLFGQTSEASQPKLLPTPSAVRYGSNQGGGMGRVGPIRYSLESMASLGLMSSAAASPVRTSVSPEKAAVLRAAALAYGRSTPELLARYDPDTSLSKTSQISEADLPFTKDGLTAAYVAGLIDGEGCLYVTKRKKWFYPRLDIAMGDKALPLIKQLHRQFGGSLNLHRKATERWDGAHRWALMGKPLLPILSATLSFLKVKKRQAELLLNLNPKDAEAIRQLVSEMNRKGPSLTREAGWFARRVGGQWLTPQTNFLEATGLTVFSETWPRSGLIVNGIAYQLPPLVPLTDEIGSGLWPAPVANDDNKSPEAHMAMKQRMKGGPRNTITSLQVMVKAKERQMWPTPAASTLIGGPHGMDGGQRARQMIRRNVDEATAKQMCSGSLNPMWVEWLMGFPLEWTALEPSEMQSFRKSRKSSGGR